jgi:heterodisulfide reductase subunit A-like polyferredoxin
VAGCAQAPDIACNNTRRRQQVPSLLHSCLGETFKLIQRTRWWTRASAEVPPRVWSCARTRPYFRRRSRNAVVDETLQGCGTCAAGCPTMAIIAQHATSEQLEAEIAAMLAASE